MCCISMHIHKGVFLIGILGLILSVFTIGWCLFFHSFVFMTIGILSFTCYLSLIVGNYAEVASLYWPFFLCMPIIIITQISFSLLTFIVHGAAMFLDAKELESDGDVQVLMHIYPKYLLEISQLTLIFGVIVLIISCIEVYFYSAVLRAYGYLQKVRKYPPPLSIGWSHRV